MSLLLRKSASWISAMAIGATEYDVLSLVHRLDTLMTLQTANALRVGLGSCLIDPIACGQSCAWGDRCLNRN